MNIAEIRSWLWWFSTIILAAIIFFAYGSVDPEAEASLIQLIPFIILSVMLWISVVSVLYYMNLED